VRTTPEATDTSGTDRRPARMLTAPLARYDLAEELRRLGSEPPGNDQDRATITLARAGTLRVAVSRLTAGSELGGDDTEGALAVVVLGGSVTVEHDGAAERAEADQLVVIDRGGPWSLTAETDAALLLAVSWPDVAAADRPV
jgi:redox-sensitive bicupin YhaK (pirin superfamily)